MDAAPQQICEKTTILDLNDDCLREVFDSMDRNDLAAVADVCNRFRQNAVQSARSKFESFSLQLNEATPAIEYSMLRNFGASIESVHVNPQRQVKCLKRFIEVLNRYCIGETIFLILASVYITDEIAHLMVPLLGRVGIMRITQCTIDRVFLENLSLWSPKLRELDYLYSRSATVEGMEEWRNIGDIDLYNSHKIFPKLESIRFWETTLKTCAIVHFLKQSPQLKHIEMGSHSFLDDVFFNLLAKYVPAIEEIHFVTWKKIYPNDIEYLSQLRQLRSLTMEVQDNSITCAQLVLHEIVMANINLEVLKISASIGERCNAQHFIGGISKLKKLKTLKLYGLQNFTAIHLIGMSKALKELSRVELIANDLQMNENEFLNFIRNAGKMREFVCDACGFKQIRSIHVDAGTFKKIVDIVDQRPEKTKLHLILGENALTGNIPAELTRAASNLLGLDFI